jgi:hypothetical protein
VVTINSAYSSLLLSLYGGSTSSNAGDSILNVLAQQWTANASSASSASGAAPAKTTVPTAPWDSASKAPQMSDLVRGVLAGQKFIDVNAAQLDVPGASDDYRKLFALYQGLNALEGLAEQATGKGVGPTQLAELQKAFSAGMQETSEFLQTAQFDKLRVTEGSSLTKDVANVGVARDSATYQTRVLHTGGPNDEVAVFQGAVQFDATVKRGTVTTQLHFDLSEMGSTPRTMSNVVNYLNSKFQAAGLATRFAMQMTPGQAQTVKAGNQTVTLPTGPDQYSLKINGDSIEQLTFSAASTANAVYLTQASGSGANGTAPDQQLLKFQTDVSDTATAPPAAQGPAGQAYNVPGRAFAQSLGPNIGAVHATATGPDGSVYVLADVTGAVNGQPIQGSQDVALLKYDSTGALVFTRTLGASGTASGLAMSVAADGKVAVAGTVTGGLDPGSPPIQDGRSDSFVTVYDNQGQELWTKRRTALPDDRATAVAFGPGDAVYVAGDGPSNAVTNSGQTNGYVEGYAWNGKSGDLSKVATVMSQTLTGARDLKMTSDGQSLFVAGEGATTSDPATVYGWSLQPDGTATAIGQQSLGALGGGQVAGIAINGSQLVIAGSAADPAKQSNPSQNPTSTDAYGGGGSDGFVAQISTSLTPSASDTFSYVGGSGADKITSLAVADGQVYVSGTSNASFGGLSEVGGQDGFLARVDPTTGAVSWGTRFTAADKTAAPSAIAVDAGGASILDRLGLPKQTLAYGQPDAVLADDTQVVSATSARPGDQFYVRTQDGGQPTAVTIAADDTFATLEAKVNRALGFQAQVSLIIDGDQKKLQIKVPNSRVSVEVMPGKAGQDALGALGLTPGVVNYALTGDGAPDKKTYGLQLDTSIDLSSPADIKHAQDELKAAMTIVQGAYIDLKQAANPPPKTSAAANGPVPTYLTNEIANYQAALDRLTGGQGAGSASGSVAGL